MGWRRCAVLYGDDVYGTSVYEVYKELAKYRNIEILNNETLRKIPVWPPNRPIGRTIEVTYWNYSTVMPE